jgi:hypothetical protein
LTGFDILKRKRGNRFLGAKFIGQSPRDDYQRLCLPSFARKQGQQQFWNFDHNSRFSCVVELIEGVANQGRFASSAGLRYAHYPGLGGRLIQKVSAFFIGVTLR